jgi:hypothetical protein
LSLLLLEECIEVREPSPLVRIGGHLLLWAIAATVCYVATL